MFAIRQIIEDPQDMIPIPPELRHRRTEVIFTLVPTRCVGIHLHRAAVCWTTRRVDTAFPRGAWERENCLRSADLDTLQILQTLSAQLL